MARSIESEARVGCTSGHVEDGENEVWTENIYEAPTIPFTATAADAPIKLTLELTWNFPCGIGPVV